MLYHHIPSIYLHTERNQEEKKKKKVGLLEKHNILDTIVSPTARRHLSLSLSLLVLTKMDRDALVLFGRIAGDMSGKMITMWEFLQRQWTVYDPGIGKS
jgi:hypothetical protein